MRQADSCVKCGLCLPHCPTYRLSADEAESPRGRIALVQAWLGGAVDGDRQLQKHLDHCLECAACERACPSLVPFVDIMDRARAERTRALPTPRRSLRRWLLNRLSRPAALHRLLGGYRRSGLQSLIRRIGLPRRLDHLERVGDSLSRPAADQPGASTGEPDILLFCGCLGRYMDGGAQAAALRILDHLGFRAQLFAGDSCCGALHRHDGFEREAGQHLEAVRKRCGEHAATPLLGLASACTAELKRDPRLASVVRDASRFIADHPWPPERLPTILPRRVLVHVPCSQANLLGDPDAAIDLLRLIPGIEVVALRDNPACCGAAGSYLLRETGRSLQLLDDKLAGIRDAGGDVLVTTNTGCAAHLRAGIEGAGLSLEVCHPLELLARQLPA